MTKKQPIINPHNDHLQVRLITQLVEHCTGIAEVRVQIYVHTWIFQAFLTAAQAALKNCKDHTHSPKVSIQSKLPTWPKITPLAGRQADKWKVNLNLFRISLMVNRLPLHCMTQQLSVTTRRTGICISRMSLHSCAQRLKFCIFNFKWIPWNAFAAMHLEKILPHVPAPEVAHSFKSAHN